MSRTSDSERKASSSVNWSKTHLLWDVLRLLGMSVAQILILVFACTFLGEELRYQCVSFDSTLTQLMQSNPRLTTAVVTLIATALSMASSALFGLSVKEAMRHRMWKPTSIVEVSAGAALVKASHILKFRKWKYVLLTAITTAIFALLKLLTTGWTTLLMPTLVDCIFDVTGTELDLAGSAFGSLLTTELAVYSPLQIHDDSFPIIDIGGSLSGISAAGTSFGLPGIFNFNGAKYNLSTGGVLPAVSTYAGSTQDPGSDGTRLSFAGGQVPVNTTVHPGKFAGVASWLGIQRNFTVYQQGLTADVECVTASEAQYQLNLTSTNSAFPVTSTQGSAYYVWAWDSSANCNGSSPSVQQYITLANSTNQPDDVGSGFLPSVICPGQRNEIQQAFQTFVVATEGYYKYSFLPSTICQVTPLLTTVRVSYSGGIIDASDVVGNQTFDSTNSALLLFLASIASYEGQQAQGTTTNSIGDALFSIYSAAENSPIANGTTEIYRELEDYWRGVVEFSATFLRSGYSAEGAFADGIPSNMTTSLNGTMWMLTMGWANRGALYLFSVLPLGLVTVLTICAAVYSISKAWSERKNIHTQTPFDVSSTLHLITACAAGGLDGKLRDFTPEGLRENEEIEIMLEEDAERVKKFVVAPPKAAVV